MSITAIIALSLLVLIAGGFHLGRRRALLASGGRPAALHSLPLYYGYHVALWTGLPAFLLIAAFGLFGPQITTGLVVLQLEREAAPLIEIYEGRLESDEAHLAALNAAAEAQAESDALDAEMQTLRRAVGEARNPERLQQLQARRPVVLDWIASTTADVEARRAEIRQDILLSDAAGEASDGSRAGFEFELAPVEQRQLFISDALRIARGMTPSRVTPELEAAAAMARPYQRLAGLSVGLGALAMAIAGLVWTLSRIRADFRARNHVERLISILLWFCSVIAVLTTVGIILSLLFESLRFFAEVPIDDFLFGLQWSPQTAIRADQVGQSGAFGAVPLFAGTAIITVIAMLVAAPIGLFAAIYLSEYAGRKTRQIVKPLLEILAGIPTVVYGFFALLVVGPALRSAAGWAGFDDAAVKSALAAGVVMGVMIIPFVSSLADDVINAVPQSLRDGAYAMGATKSETITQVILPAALPGVVGALLLAVSRAIGETMIVVMAAGQGANLTANPLESVTTITVQIVTLLTGDQEFDSAKTLSAFALALVLFTITLILNIVALRVVQKYREKYD